MNTNTQYIKSEKELLRRAESVASSNDSSELVCRISSDMTNSQKKQNLRAARAKARAIVAKIEADENRLTTVTVATPTEYQFSQMQRTAMA